FGGRAAIRRRNFGKGDVPGGAHEFLKLPFGHRRLINPETTDGNAVHRRLFGIVLVRSHAEGTAGDEDHLGCAFAIHRYSFRNPTFWKGLRFPWAPILWRWNLGKLALDQRLGTWFADNHDQYYGTVVQ